MKRLRSYLFNHQGCFDKIMLTCFALGMGLIGIGLYQGLALIMIAEAEFDENDLRSIAVLKDRQINPIGQIPVPTEVTPVKESDPYQPPMASLHLLDGIDFSSDGAQITLEIMPDEGRFDHNQPIEITFSPGDHCEFGDGHACVYEFNSSAGKKVIMTSVHSGWGAEAEAFRDYLEGTGFFQALHTEEQVQGTVESLIGSVIRIHQGELITEGFQLIEIIRVPPTHFNDYLALPIEKTLDYAIEVTRLAPSILDQDLLVFETCGWKLPGEAPVNGLDYTSNAIYLGLVQIINDK